LHILKSENLILHSSAHKQGINAFVFGELMLHRISCSVDSTCTVLSDNREVGVVIDTPKSSNNHHNQVTFAVKLGIALNSASALERETPVYFFVFHAMREPPRNPQ
jgi:hypothetical protein